MKNDRKSTQHRTGKPITNLMTMIPTTTLNKEEDMKTLTHTCTISEILMEKNLTPKTRQKKSEAQKEKEKYH